MTRIPIDGTHNFRPVQGVREGSLYRADALARLSRDGRDGLRELGVSRVIDLRTDFDRRLGGRDRLRGVGADLVRIPMLGTARREDIPTLTLESMYRRLLAENAPQLAAAIRAVATAPDGAVVVHCTAGKDRSGLTSALIQLALDVPVSVVVEDYARTEGNLAGAWATRMVRRVRRLRIELTPALEEVLVGSPVRAIESTLAHLHETHGGPAAYLESIDVTAEDLTALRARLAVSRVD